MEPNADVTPTVLQPLLQNRTFVLLDVREEDEREISVLPDDAHIPVGEIGARLGELDPERELVVYCRSGARSGRVATFLRGIGFRNVHNLLGGVNAWSDQVDPSMRKY